MIRLREIIELLGYCSIMISVGAVTYGHWLGGYGEIYVFSYKAYTVFMLMTVVPGIVNLVLTIVYIRHEAKIKNGINLVVGAFSLLLLLLFFFVAA